METYLALVLRRRLRCGEAQRWMAVSSERIDPQLEEIVALVTA
jgi:hypothetical protein